MTGLGTLHFLLVGIWFGLVLAEIVMELWGRGQHDREIARLHFWIDVLLEIPIVFGVLGTGILLMLRLEGPLSLLLQVKIGLGLTAIAVNLYCASLVVLRGRQADHPEQRDRLTGRIYHSFIGIPFGLAALLLALRHLGVL